MLLISMCHKLWSGSERVILFDINKKKQINSGLEWPAGPPKVHNSLTTKMTNIIIDESADHV